jgi:hypothetical protein
MTAIAVRVVDSNGAAVLNMAVQIYDQTNTTLLDTQYTDALGDVAFNEVDARYQLRFHGEHILAAVTSPQQINVKTPPPANSWQFTATTFTAPIAVNPAMCRCWGFFIDGAGLPIPNLYLRLSPQQNPAAVYAMPVGHAQSPIELITDSAGYFEVDLVRGALFSVTLAGYIDASVDIEVPAQASFNMIGMLFPAPEAVTYVPPGPLALGVDATASVVPTVLMSDGRSLLMDGDPPTASDFIDFSSSDETIMLVEGAGGQLTLTGVAPGAATIIATARTTAFLPRLPAVVLTVTPVAVVVS